MTSNNSQSKVALSETTSQAIESARSELVKVALLRLRLQPRFPAEAAKGQPLPFLRSMTLSPILATVAVTI